MAGAANTAPVPFGSGTALRFGGDSFASMPVRIGGAFHLSFWLRSRDWFRGSESFFSLNNANGDVVLNFRTSRSGADLTFMFAVNVDSTAPQEFESDPVLGLYRTQLDAKALLHFDFSYIESLGKSESTAITDRWGLTSLTKDKAAICLTMNDTVVYERETALLVRSDVQDSKEMTLDWGATQGGGGKYKYFLFADLDDVRLWSIRDDQQQPPVSYWSPVHGEPPELLAYHDFDRPVHRNFRVTPELQARIGANGTCRRTKHDAVACNFVSSSVLAPLGGRMLIEVRAPCLCMLVYTNHRSACVYN